MGYFKTCSLTEYSLTYRNNEQMNTSVLLSYFIQMILSFL